jgi:hypothetical protein
MKCQNCALEDDEQLRQCKTCHSWVCHNCYLEHLRWGQELFTTDKMVRKALRIEQQITDGMDLLERGPALGTTTSYTDPETGIKKQMRLDDLFW